jgi:oxalate decarboxylase/phosphoglucose isomerase-like protein (cupin superfamily)
MKLIISNNRKYNIEFDKLFDPIFNSSFEKIICKGKELKGFCENYIDYSSYEYYVFRYIYDEYLPEFLNVKYDITVLPFSRDLNTIPRTRGHYHLINGIPPKQYFDIYQVINGNIIFQTHLHSPKTHKAYFWIAKQGDILVLPPDMCHVLYNIGNDHAILSNWCTRKEHLDYEGMKKTNGPAFFIKEFKDKDLKLIKNQSFNCQDIIPEIILPQFKSEIIKDLGFESQFILDWAFEGEGLKIMNEPNSLSNWIENFSQKQNSFTYSY